MIIYLTPPEYNQTCANEHEYKDKASYYSGYLLTQHLNILLNIKSRKVQDVNWRVDSRQGIRSSVVKKDSSRPFFLLLLIILNYISIFLLDLMLNLSTLLDCHRGLSLFAMP